MRYEGNIYRPPGEWKSYLLQVTVGCSHNACTFCGMYKDKRYRVRPLEEIFEDIAMAKAACGDVSRVFLCDGDAVAMDTADLLAVLKKLYETFPSLERVNAYAGPVSTLARTDGELKALREAGLARLYLGVESGSDTVLKAVRKGVDAAGMLEAGRRLVAAGFDVWVMVLIGLAGPGAASRAHALDTAAMVNAMGPRHLSALTYIPERGTVLGRAVERGEFQLLTAREALEETRLLLERLEVNPLHFTSDHASNYLPLKGGLPEDRGATALPARPGPGGGAGRTGRELAGPVEERKRNMDDNHLHILWTNADPVVFDKMVLMYAVNSLVRGWWERVTVILWGETARLAARDAGVRERIQLAMDQGVRFSACVTCARELGVEEKLRNMGLEVISWGPPLTELLKARAPLLTV